MEFLIIPGVIAAVLGFVLVTGTDDTVVIDGITPNPMFEDMGFTEEALTDRLMLELRRLVYAADISPGTPIFDLANDNSFAEELARLIGAEGLVTSTRQFLGEIDYMVEGHFTEVDGVSTLDVLVENYNQSTETVLSYTIDGPDPTSAITQLARDLLLMVDPYVIALDTYTRARATGDFEQTMTMIDYGIARGPDEIAHRFYNLRGLVNAQMGNNDEALRDFETALLTGSDDIYSHFNRAISLGIVGRREEMRRELTTIASGEADWMRGFDIPPNIYSLANVELAQVYVETGDDATAINFLRRAIEIDPFLPQAHLLLAEAFRRGDLDLLAPYHERIAQRLLRGTDDASVEALLDTTEAELARYRDALHEQFNAIEQSDLRFGHVTTVVR